MDILNFLSELASATPNSHEINNIINRQPDNIQEVVKNNNGQALKNLISHNQCYANETTVTLY